MPEKGFTPETNNVMEQLFSLVDDVINQARSFQPEKIKKPPEQPGKIYILAIPNILLIPL